MISFAEQKFSKKCFFYALFFLVISVFLFSLFLGRYPVSVMETLGILFQKPLNIKPFWSEQTEMILLEIRLPRVLLACLVGGALSVAGATYQGVFQNPMASPDILGASSGACFGAALALLFGANELTLLLSAFVFSLVATSLVWVISKKAQGRQILALILCGIVIGSLFSVATSFIKLIADPSDELPAITYWLMGSLAAADDAMFYLSLIPMFIGLVPLFLLRWKINILTLGDEEAKTLGVEASQLRMVLIFCATLVTASCVAVSGLIGWVGLLIPHIARRFVGENYRYLIPASMLIGAIFLPLIDDIARNALPSEIPIGILTSFIGSPFFLYLMIRKDNPV